LENQVEKKIMVLRIDNGGDLYGIELEEFYKNSSIERWKTTPYTPKQNGVIERMNMTLVEKTRSMLNGVD
jgi:transposase InsO family protein